MSVMTIQPEMSAAAAGNRYQAISAHVTAAVHNRSYPATEVAESAAAR